MLTKKPHKKNKQPRSKSKTRRQKTFNSSEFTFVEDRNHLSHCDIFKNDIIKKKNESQRLNSSIIPKTKKNKSQKNLITTKKKTKNKSKPKLNKSETYEVVPFKNSLNSEIVFSNEDTKRQEKNDYNSQKTVSIKLNQKFLIASNRMVKNNIKQQYQKKVQSAIKIQKVFRGFMTRKILQKYVINEHKVIYDRITHQRHNRSDEVSEHSSYFAEKSAKKQPPVEVIEHINKYQMKSVSSSSQSSYEEREQMENIVYRHHEPIYSHSQISAYLQSSDEQEEYDAEAFENNIIFETNQQYLDSRKSSYQTQNQPKNKLSKAGQPDSTENNREKEQKDDYTLQSDLVKTQKKVEKDRFRIKGQLSEQFKEETIKLTEQTDHQHLPTVQFQETISYEQVKDFKKKDLNNAHSNKKQEEQEQELIEKLKEQEKNKWDQIIDMVSNQIKKTLANNSEMTNFMETIKQMSIKNKEILQINIEKLTSVRSARETQMKMERQQSFTKHKKSFKSKRQYLSNLQFFDEDSLLSEQEKFNQPVKVQIIMKEHTLPQKVESPNGQIEEFQIPPKPFKVDLPTNPLSPLSSLQNTGKIKKFLMGNFQDNHIDEMLSLREELLKNRQHEQLKKLNQELSNQSISHQNFLKKLENLTHKFQSQKSALDKSKEDISRGHTAALTLTKEAFCEAKKLGFNLPVSRSMEGFQHKAPIHFTQLVIDQMVTYRKEKSQKKTKKKYQKINKMFEDEESFHHKNSCESQHQSSDMSFTEEQLNRFRRAQPYDLQIAEEISDLNKKVMISEDFLRQQSGQNIEKQKLMITDKHVFKEVFEIQETQSNQKHPSPQTDMITEKLIQFLLTDFAGQLLVKPIFSQRLIDKEALCKPKCINNQQRTLFIKILQQCLPSKNVLNEKLNQKICPLPCQLLKCMRIDFSEDDEQDDNSYQQIGKYEFIINQQICNTAIQRFKDEIEKSYEKQPNNLMDIEQLNKEYPLSEKIIKYLNQRQKYLINRKKHTRQLRWQVLNIEVHCIFDAWNQQLIFLRSKKTGYSGIGLNQLTLSVKDHNSQIQLSQTISFLNEGKKSVQDILKIEDCVINEQQNDEVIDSDSKWIFYADEALSYALQLVYLIEEELYGQFSREMRKKFMHRAQF